MPPADFKAFFSKLGRGGQLALVDQPSHTTGKLTNRGLRKNAVRPAAGQEAALTDQRILSSPL